MPTIEQRFWEKVQKTPTCWIWMGAITKGYGQLGKDRKVIYSHRLAYEMFVGEIPKEFTIDHLCRNRACVNPAHLEAVSQRDNILRGIGVTAQHARATHCPKGHPYNLLNTYLRRGGRRNCKTCIAEASLARSMKGIHGSFWRKP